MTSAFVAKLGLSTQPTNVGIQKIHGFVLKIYDMTIAGFLIQDELSKLQFFEEIFLLADTSMDVVLGKLFLFLSNTDV